jgi:dihydroflavonol-4-reductase
MLLVTGATGFLGHSLIPYLARAGYRVRALVRPGSDLDWLARRKVELAFGDVCDAGSVVQAMVGCRQVVHAAAHFRLWGREEVFRRTNVVGTQNVLQAARDAGVERFVHVSTVVVIGRPLPGRVIDEAHPTYPSSPYERTKLVGEGEALRAWREDDLPVVVLRPGAFYGPWGRYAWNRLFFEDPMRGLLIKVRGGKPVTFPVFIEDASQAINLAIRRGRPGEIYNVCSEILTHNEANAIISDLAGLRHFRLNVPPWSMIALAGLMTIWARVTGVEPFYPLALKPYVFESWPVSSQKARDELGFVPTPFEEGACRTLCWYRRIGVWKGKRQPWEEMYDDKDSWR